MFEFNLKLCDYFTDSFVIVEIHLVQWIFNKFLVTVCHHYALYLDKSIFGDDHNASATP